MDDKQRMIEEKELIIFLQNHWWDGYIDAIAHSLIAAGFGDVKGKGKRIAVLERALAFAILMFDNLSSTEQCGTWAESGVFIRAGKLRPYICKKYGLEPPLYGVSEQELAEEEK